MRNVVPSLLAALLSISPALGADAVPRAVPQAIPDGAQKATEALGKEVLKGNFSHSIQKMYDRYQKRAAVRAGGMEKLIAKFAKVPGEMRKKGIEMLKFEAQAPTSVHEVHLGRGRDKAGKPVQEYLEWLVFVPTRTEFRMIDPATRQAKKIETFGYQVAIANKAELAKKGLEAWRFIDGSNLTIPELRSFFPSLPDDAAKLGLPPVGGKEVK